MSILSNLYMILAMRIVHVAGGIIWVGSAILYLLLLLPAAKSAESAGQRFMQNFGPRFGKMMGIVTTLTVLSGAILYSRFFAGGARWIWETGAGLAFTTGAMAALVSYVIGAGIFGPTQKKIELLGEAMASAGGPARPEQVTEMSRLQTFLVRAYRVDFALLLVAMLAMAVARYL